MGEELDLGIALSRSLLEDLLEEWPFVGAWPLGNRNDASDFSCVWRPRSVEDGRVVRCRSEDEGTDEDAGMREEKGAGLWRSVVRDEVLEFRDEVRGGRSAEEGREERRRSMEGERRSAEGGLRSAAEGGRREAGER